MKIKHAVYYKGESEKPLFEAILPDQDGTFTIDNGSIDQHYIPEDSRTIRVQFTNILLTTDLLHCGSGCRTDRQPRTINDLQPKTLRFSDDNVIKYGSGNPVREVRKID